jgi:hypothetical protein
MNGQRRERLAAIMTVPDNYVFGASGVQAIHRGIDFTGEKLAHFLIFWIGLILPANTGDTFSIGDEENGFA